MKKVSKGAGIGLSRLVEAWVCFAGRSLQAPSHGRYLRMRPADHRHRVPCLSFCRMNELGHCRCRHVMLSDAEVLSG